MIYRQTCCWCSEAAAKSSITMGAFGIDRGWAFPAALTNELIEPMAEVLHLARSQDATHSHKLGIVRVVVTTRSRVGMATSSQLPALHLWSLSGSRPRQAGQGPSRSWCRLVTQETRQPFQGLAGGWRRDSRVRLAFWGFIIPLGDKLVQEVQPEEKREIRWNVVFEELVTWSTSMSAAVCIL